MLLDYDRRIDVNFTESCGIEANFSWSTDTTTGWSWGVGTHYTHLEIYGYQTEEVGTPNPNMLDLGTDLTNCSPTNVLTEATPGPGYHVDGEDDHVNSHRCKGWYYAYFNHTDSSKGASWYWTQYGAIIYDYKGVRCVATEGWWKQRAVPYSCMATVQYYDNPQWEQPILFGPVQSSAVIEEPVPRP